MRVFTGLLLSLCLAVTSLTMAVARGQARVGGVVVLCTGTGPLAVTVDGEGKPLQRRHICPDCALSLFAATTEAPQPLLAPSAFRRVPSAPVPVGAAPFLGPRPALARGPPVPV